MKVLRKLICPLLVLFVAGGLIYTLTLDTSTPVEPPEPEATTDQLEEEQTPTGLVYIAYTVGDVRLQFAQDDQGIWQWQDDTSFPLDETNIAQVAAQLEAMTHLRAVPLDDTTPASDYGLDKPWCTIDGEGADGTTLTLAFGNCGDEENTHYVLKNGDESRALVYEMDWTDLLFVPIYDMMRVPALPELTPDTVQGLVVTVGETVAAWQPAFADGQTDTWHVAGQEEPVEHGELMVALSQLQATKCFSYKPSEGAVTICGFDAPSDVVITWGESLENPQYLDLSFGTLAMDKAYRYMRMGEESTIYLVEEAVAAPLLALAE